MINKAENFRDLAAIIKMAELAYYHYQAMTIQWREKHSTLISPAWGYTETHPEVIAAKNKIDQFRALEFLALDYIAELVELWDLWMRETVEQLSNDGQVLGEALNQLEIKATPIPFQDLQIAGKQF